VGELGIGGSFEFVDRKVIIRLKDRGCETPEELLSSPLFREVVLRYVRKLERSESPVLAFFGEGRAIGDLDVDELIQVFELLARMPLEWVAKVLADQDRRRFLEHPASLHAFVEGLYDYWRQFERFIVCDSEGDVLDRRPYRTFHATSESLMHLVRGTYRDIQNHLSSRHLDIYRQVMAGAEVAAIALPKPISLPGGCYDKLRDIPVIRQVLLYPPLLLNPPMNKRTGSFVRVEQNPLELVDIECREWLCYPAKVGKLLVLVCFHEKFFELGFSLSNLFELADNVSLQQPVDAIYLFGVSENSIDGMASLPTVFYDDTANNLLVAAVPRRNEFGYFGYLKKMVLTLHNIKVMKMGWMPYHGAMIRLRLKGDHDANVLILGDTGTGKSETLEAFRGLGEDQIREIVIIADDMGALDIAADGKVLGYGTEVGAFVRLDDLQPGYAFGQLDRAIIMNPNQVNARVVLPVTRHDDVVRGYPVDMVLYANNYEEVDDDHPIIERFNDPTTALKLFREGTAMSKGTTTTTGLVHTYFANIFGPVQYRSLHEEIAHRFFDHFFEQGLFVGQLRTRLGIAGWERKGPEEAARALLDLLQADSGR
jgi:energy-coupling factor transporter ATP-binding protein EcfA2